MAPGKKRTLHKGECSRNSKVKRSRGKPNSTAHRNIDDSLYHPYNTRANLNKKLTIEISQLQTEVALLQLKNDKLSSKIREKQENRKTDLILLEEIQLENRILKKLLDAKIKEQTKMSSKNRHTVNKLNRQIEEQRKKMDNDREHNLQLQQKTTNLEAILDDKN